jgi:hypothetical protein
VHTTVKAGVAVGVLLNTVLPVTIITAALLLLMLLMVTQTLTKVADGCLVT